MAGRADWAKLIEDFEQSGLTHREFSEQRKISIHGLRSWLYRRRREGKTVVDGPMQMLPVRVRSRSKKEPTAAAAPVEIVFDGLVVRVAEGANVVFVATLVRTLRG
jgi:hypothetical protein